MIIIRGLLTIAISVVLMLWAITVFMIIKIRRWSVDEEMRAWLAG